MEWENSYIDALIEGLHPVGKVLEIGFLAYSSKRIQSFHPKHHTILESDSEIAAKASDWAKGNPAISVIQGRWEEALPKLGVFDAIFFNDFKPSIEEEKAQCREVGSLVVEKGKKIVSQIKEEIPQLVKFRYSNSELEEFLGQVGKSQSAQLSIFIHELLENGQISEEQYEHLVHQYHLEKKGRKCIEKEDPIMRFLKLCLKKHMHKGSRFSCFCAHPLSKYEDPEFFETIITSPHFSYQEKLISVEVPKSCQYYKYKEALVMVVEKL